MFQKKNLIINSDVCDTRKMKAEDYSGYESIVINGDIVIVSPSSKGILARLPVVQNCDATIELEEDEDIGVNVINGSGEITPKTVMRPHTIMVVNGSLHVEPGAEKVLESCERIVVNGTIEIPKSLEGFLDKIHVNGILKSYPDGCIMLKDELLIDRIFPLRAEQGACYHVSETVIISDKTVDLGKLAEKQVRFITPQVILPECMVEDSVALFDIQTEYVVIPDGLELVYGDAVLDEKLIREKGGNLFVCGDLEADREADMEQLAAKIGKLVVTGCVAVTRAQKDAFMRLGAAYNELEVVRGGRVLSDKVKVKVDQALIDSSPEGIEICDVVKVVIAEEVAAETILQKLSLHHCASVICSEEQENAVSLISEDVANIGREGDEEKPVAGIFSKMKDAKIINAENYVL